MKKKKTKLFQWFDDRFHIQALLDYLGKKDVPIGYGYLSDLQKANFTRLQVAYHAAKRPYVWYYFGGLTLFFFIILVITGILLLFYYQNGEDTAHESIGYIMTEVPYGWLIRSMHSWAANMMIACAFIHMFSVFFQKAYRKPRELTWITGFILLFLSMTEGFTGYVLPWTKLSYFGVQIVADLLVVVPFIGADLKYILLGGDKVTANTLHRFLGFHVTIFPLLIFALIAAHLMFIQRQGMSQYLYAKDEARYLKQKHNLELPYRKMSFFPNFILRDFIVWLIAFNILVIVSCFLPWELGEKADPLSSAPPNLKPEWWFLAVFIILEVVPKEVGLGLVGLVSLIWCFIPFLDTKSKVGQRSLWVTLFGLAFFLGFLILTIIGFAFTTEQITTTWHAFLHFVGLE